MEYSPRIFDVKTPQEARNIILTPQNGLSPDHRWRTETPYLRDIIDSRCHKGKYVLDYGCGIGRLSRELVNQNRIITGVDISWSMRALAHDNVRSENFAACHPKWLRQMLRFDSLTGYDLCIAIWALQHCEKPEEDIALIKQCLTRRAGQLFVVNNNRRVVPTTEGWADDGVDINGLLCEAGQLVFKEQMDPNIIGPEVAKNTFMALYQF